MNSLSLFANQKSLKVNLFSRTLLKLFHFFPNGTTSTGYSKSIGRACFQVNSGLTIATDATVVAPIRNPPAI